MKSVARKVSHSLELSCRFGRAVRKCTDSHGLMECICQLYRSGCAAGP